MKITLIIFALSMVVCLANAEDNKSLKIEEQGTSFFLSGLEETTVYDLTIEGWVKLDGSQVLTDFTALVDFRNAADAQSKALIFRTVGGNITASYEWNENWTYQGADNIVEVDEWQHVAVVVSGNDAEARFYINGMAVGSDNSYTGLGEELPLGASIRVGAGKGANPERTLIGLMDEIRIWTVARTDDEIFDNMNKEIDPTTEGLLMYYKCNEDIYSEQLVDATGNGFDLSIVDGAGYYEFVDDSEWNTDKSSIRFANNSKAISTYPNPVIDQLFFKSMDFQNPTIDILDVTGKLISRSLMQSSSVNVSNLKKGMYFIHVSEGSKMYHGKFIKE
jgi:hypothetical protein